VIAVKPRLVAFILLLPAVTTVPAADSGVALAFDSMPAAQFKFVGPVGERMEANIENWLLRAPQSNPGMIGMEFPIFVLPESLGGSSKGQPILESLKQTTRIVCHKN